MWLTDPLMPDIKTIADFRKDNGLAIRSACKQFLVLCRRLNLFTKAAVAIDGCKFQVQLEANILRDPYQPSLRSSGTDRERRVGIGRGIYSRVQSRGALRSSRGLAQRSAQDRPSTVPCVLIVVHRV
jgi:hypothetical protein